MQRISLDDYFLKVAAVVGERSTCRRHNMGAISVRDKHILSTGYNGAAAGLKDCYGDGLRQVAVWASPVTRHARLAGRRLRGLTGTEAVARDRAEIENSNKGGPIAIADYIIVNESSLEELARQTVGVIERIGGQVAAA